jgi:hypothetical protein
MPAQLLYAFLAEVWKSNARLDALSASSKTGRRDVELVNRAALLASGYDPRHP